MHSHNSELYEIFLRKDIIFKNVQFNEGLTLQKRKLKLSFKRNIKTNVIYPKLAKSANL